MSISRTVSLMVHIFLTRDVKIYQKLKMMCTFRANCATEP